MSFKQPTTRFLSGCLTFFICGTVFLTMTSVQGQEIKRQAAKETSININNHVVVVSGRMSLGVINGQSQELVYAPEINHTLSRLTWDISGVYMLGLGGSVSPLSWLRFNADVWFKLNEGNGTMNDFDWFVEDFQYTHWSHHESVDLTKGFMFDINGEAKFYEFEKNRFYGIVGFKHDNWEWKAYGGDYIYSSYYLYDTVGSFPEGELGITYEQNFYVPYVGLGFSSDLSSTPLTFSGRIIGSTFVYGDDKDHHHMRDLLFEEDFDSGSMLAFDLAGSYNFSKNIALMISYHYQDYREMKGETTITDLVSGEVTKYTGDVAGMDHRSSLISLSAKYTF